MRNYTPNGLCTKFGEIFHVNFFFTSHQRDVYYFFLLSVALGKWRKWAVKWSKDSVPVMMDAATNQRLYRNVFFRWSLTVLLAVELVSTIGLAVYFFYHERISDCITAVNTSKYEIRFEMYIFSYDFGWIDRSIDRLMTIPQRRKALSGWIKLWMTSTKCVKVDRGRILDGTAGANILDGWMNEGWGASRQLGWRDLPRRPLWPFAP